MRMFWGLAKVGILWCFVGRVFGRSRGDWVIILSILQRVSLVHQDRLSIYKFFLILESYRYRGKLCYWVRVITCLYYCVLFAGRYLTDSFPNFDEFLYYLFSFSLQAIQESLLPPSVHMKKRKKDKASQKFGTNGVVQRNGDSEVEPSLKSSNGEIQTPRIHVDTSSDTKSQSKTRSRSSSPYPSVSSLCKLIYLSRVDWFFHYLLSSLMILFNILNHSKHFKLLPACMECFTKKYYQKLFTSHSNTVNREY